MSKTVADVIDFEFGSPGEIYSLLMDSGKISEITGFKTSMSSNVGDKFKALNGMVYGQNLYVVLNRMIIQSWRRITWKKYWLDAVVIIALNKRDNGTRIDLINANLPNAEVQFIDWNTYWNPIKAYLQGVKV
jgi:activator of HSP90 ATPase